MKEKQPLSREELKAGIKRRNRLLIPVNLVVIILSLVAAFTIVFSPLITINAGPAIEALAAQNTDDANGEEEGGLSKYMDILKGFGNLKLSFSTLDLAKFAFSENSMEIVIDIVADTVDDVVEDVLGTALTELVKTMTEDLPINTDDLDVGKIMDKFDGIVNAKNEAEARESINELAKELQSELKTESGESLIPDEVLDSFGDILYEMYEGAVEALDGQEMTKEALISVTISKFLNGSLSFGGDGEPAENGEESARHILPVAARVADAEEEVSGNGSGYMLPEGTVYTTYRDLISALLGDSSSGESEGLLGGATEIINNVSSYVGYVVYAMFAFAGVWALLALFALLHLILPNKRFTMWYVKLLGFFPALIWLVLALAGVVLPIFITDAAALEVIALIPSVLTSSTWICGLCYILLWLVSIFWAFPIKRKIRKAKRELKNL